MDEELKAEERTCSLCGKPFFGFGHNPAPLIDDFYARCCDECNNNVVTPARFGVQPKVGVYGMGKPAGWVQP